MLDVVTELEKTAGDSPKRAVACARAAIQVLSVGEPERARRLLDEASRAKGDPSVDGALADAAFSFHFLAGRILHPDISLRARARYAEMGDRRSAIIQSTNAVMSLALIGAPDEGLRLAEELGAYDYATLHSRVLKALFDHGDIGPMLALSDALPVERLRASLRVWTSALLFHRDRAAALAELDRVFAMPLSPALRPVATALKARFATGEEALRLAEEAVRGAERGIIAIGPSIVPIAHVEALEGVGRHDAARQVLRDAMIELESAAAELGEWGPVYLERGLCVAELREMARARGVSR
jgi:hypothetical protein